MGDASAGRSGAGWRLALGPALFALVLWLAPGGEPGVARMAGLTLWMAAWWVTEAVPVPITSLLPLVLMPALDIAPVATVARDYGREIIFLFLGGFLLALGLQASGMHRRIALTVAALVGSRPRRLVLGFMLASGGLSMWISNTSATLLLLPITLSVLATAAGQAADPALVRRLGAPLMLGIAHGATIGGLATPVGTPTNLVFRQVFPQLYPAAPVPGFAEWMAFGVPLSLAYVLIGWWLLVRVIFPLPDQDVLGGHDAIGALRRALGPLRRDELLSGAAFAATALLWISGKAWQDLPALGGRIDDNVVAVGMASLLFMIPSRDRPGERLLEWRHAAEVPWGILLLFGGGFALATGFGASGLSAWAAAQFLALAGSPPLLVLAVVCVVLVLLSEFASNTATAQIALPILASAAASLDLDPRALMVPATFAASCAFMMPVGTPPSSIVFGSGHVSIRDMVKAGIWFNVLGLVLVIGLFRLLGGPLLGIEFGPAPDWARP